MVMLATCLKVDTAMADEYLTTKEVAELLRIKERKVYDLAADKQIPCTRATGKLLFSHSAIRQWLAQHSSGNEHLNRKAPALFAGSHDPLLEWAIRESQCGIPVLFDGSSDGLSKVANGEATVTAMHIYVAGTGRWNIDAVQQLVADGTESVVLIHWLNRRRGLIMKQGLGLSDLCEIASHKVVVRQAGAGSQLLLHHLLSDAGIELKDLDVVLTARSEADVALAISEGRADCGLGLESLAGQHQLEFLPLVTESFDLLVKRWFWFEAPMQRFVEFCHSEMFRQKVQQTVGYKTDKMMSVLYNA